MTQCALQPEASLVVVAGPKASYNRRLNKGFQLPMSVSDQTLGYQAHKI